MKNFTLFTILFSLLISSGLFAQTINSDVIPEMGDGYFFRTADTVGIEPGPDGSDVVWDFSSLDQMIDPGASFFKNPDWTPYADEFPNANLASETAVPEFGSTYSYYERNGGDWNLLGSMSGDVKVDETENPELIFSTPFDYGAIVYDDYQGVTTSPDATIYNFGEKTMTFDASGTLLMPGAEFGDAMRVVTINTRVDSTSFGTVVSETTTTTESYSWYASGVVGPIITITYTSGESVTTVSGLPPTVTTIPTTKSISFNPDATPGVNATSQVNLSFAIDRIYPTPADDEVFVAVLHSDKMVTVNARLFNMLGRQMAATEWRVVTGGQTFTFDLSGLPSGMYLLNIEEGQAQGTYRVVKK